MHRSGNQGMMNMLNQHQQPQQFHQSQFQQPAYQQQFQQPQNQIQLQLPQILQKHFEHIQTLYNQDTALQREVQELRGMISRLTNGQMASSVQQPINNDSVVSRDFRTPVNNTTTDNRYTPPVQTQQEEQVMETQTFEPETVAKENNSLVLKPMTIEHCPDVGDFKENHFDPGVHIKALDSLVLSEDFGGIGMEPVLFENKGNFKGFFGLFGITQPGVFLDVEKVKEDLMSAPEGIAAVLRRLIRTAKTIEEIAFVKGVNETLTDKLNDYLYTNFISVTVNSFMDDYDEVLRNMKEYIKDEVYNEFFDNFNLIVTRAVRETYRSAMSNELEVEGKIPLYCLCDLLFLDYNSFMLGLDTKEISYDRYTKLEENVGFNKQILPFIKNTCRKAVNAKRPVYLMTKDNKLFKFNYGELGVFVTRIDTVF